MKTEHNKYFVIIFVIIYSQIATNKYLCACECEKQIKRQNSEDRIQKVEIRRDNSEEKTQQREIDIEHRTLNIEQNNKEPQVIYPKEYKDIKFIGVEKCKLCHSREYRKWQKTKHARAYKKNVDEWNSGWVNGFDSSTHTPIHSSTNCASCHTTGYGYKFGFIDKQVSSNLAGVQCEVCHGPGGEHRKKPNEIKMAFGEKPIEESLCRSCHREEAGMGFVFGEYVEKIKCKGKNFE